MPILPPIANALEVITSSPKSVACLSTKRLPSIKQTAVNAYRQPLPKKIDPVANTAIVILCPTNSISFHMGIFLEKDKGSSII